MSQKTCDMCGKKPGSVHYTEVEDAHVVKRFICTGCAQERGLLDEPAKPVVALQELLSAPAKPPPELDTPEIVCAMCGLEFGSFRKTGRLGCGDCYATFAQQLVPLLRKIHSRVRHVGKAPQDDARKVDLRQRVEDLRQELERAVRAEDYERAAQVRDDMRALEEKQSHAAKDAGRPRVARRSSTRKGSG